ncbi:hypothetical protein FQN50_002232 [Emmonsiellopsis sp. PD_5]|nr:hypothetical protein FQN50_002232 [Emmonsiellopsis sp. PD_5]
MASSPFSSRSEDPVPSYEESLSSTAYGGGISKHVTAPSPSLPLPSHLADTRTQRINSILSTYVDPLLLSQGAAGLYKTNFVLVPSSVSSLQDAVSNAYTTPEEPQVVGFPSGGVVKLVRLKGEEHAMEFWRQPAVVAELDSSLKARLVASGHRIYQPTEKTPAITSDTDAASVPSPAAASTAASKKSFWGRAKSLYASKGQDLNDVVIVDSKLGWRAAEPQSEGAPGKIPTGLVSVSVVWKEVCLRISNEMGLYESKKGPALCMTVEVGS